MLIAPIPERSRGNADPPRGSSPEAIPQRPGRSERTLWAEDAMLSEWAIRTEDRTRCRRHRWTRRLRPLARSGAAAALGEGIHDRANQPGIGGDSLCRGRSRRLAS